MRLLLFYSILQNALGPHRAAKVMTTFFLLCVIVFLAIVVFGMIGLMAAQNS